MVFGAAKPMAVKAMTFSFPSPISLGEFVQRLLRALHTQVRKIHLDMTMQKGFEEARQK